MVRPIILATSYKNSPRIDKRIGKVYDATSVLEWHPGGKAAVLGHAGQLHQETSDEFASIHDSFAYQKLGGK